MLKNWIRIPRRLHARMEKLAECRGYSSVRECALHVLEKAADEADPPETDPLVLERLKGLGYIEE